jgi:hypothetical protein
VAVIHGDSTDPDCSERLMALTSGKGVEHLGIGWKNSSPWYDYASFAWIPGKINALAARWRVGPNPSLERTSTGLARWPRNHSSFPRTRGQHPAAPAQLKR